MHYYLITEQMNGEQIEKLVKSDTPIDGATEVYYQGIEQQDIENV